MVNVFILVCTQYTSRKNENAVIDVKLMLGQDYLLEFIVRGKNIFF